jgi:hypothetical protein
MLKDHHQEGFMVSVTAELDKYFLRHGGHEEGAQSNDLRGRIAVSLL